MVITMVEETLPSNEDIGQALADGLGLDTGPAPAPEGVEEFFQNVKKSRMQEETPVEQAGVAQADGDEVSNESFVHEPTGKVFKSEIELLKYNNGYDVQRLGEANKELRESLAELRGRVEQAATSGNQQPPNLKRQVWPKASDDVLNDPAADFILEGLEGAAGMILQQTRADNQKLTEQVEALQRQFEETTARSNSGIDSVAEQRVLEKHPGLKALPVADRMAMIKDLLGASASKTGSGKLLEKISAHPADHVEGSSLSTPQNADAALADEFEKLNDSKKELSILGRMFAEQRNFAGWDS